MSQRQLQAPLTFYILEGMPRHLYAACTEVLKRTRNDPTLRLWQAMGLSLEGKVDEALRALRVLEQDPLVGPAALAGSLQAHSQSLMVDSAAVDRIQADLDMLEASAGDEARVELARVFWSQGQHEKARGLLEDITLVDPSSVPAQALLGWVILSQMELDDDVVEGEDNAGDAAKAFDAALDASDLDPEAALGKVRLLRREGDHEDALSMLADLVVRYPWLVPAEVERMRILLAQSRWDDAADSAHRALETDDTNAEALATLALCAAAKDGRTGEAARYAAMVADGLAKAEPRYAKLMSTASSAFARMSTHDEELLDAARRLAEMAQRAGGGAGAVAAMAFCEAAAGNVQKALAMYDRAVDEDATAVGAILGSVRCLLALGRAEEAGMKADGLIESFRSFEAQDAEVMAVAAGTDDTEVPRMEGISPMDQATVLYLKAASMFAALTDGRAAEAGSAERRMAFLEQAMVYVGQACKGATVSLEAVAVHVDVSIALDIAILALQHAPGSPQSGTEAASRELDMVTRHLQRLTRVFPGHPGVMVLSATCMLLSGNTEGALRRAQGVLQSAPELAEAHLLAARISLHTKNLGAAKRALEQGVTQGYKIRLLPQYHLMMARLHILEGDHAQALKFIDQAEKMPLFRDRTVPRVQFSRGGCALNTYDRVQLLLLRAEAYQGLGKRKEAQNAVTRAEKEFTGTAEHATVTLAGTELKIQNGDVSGAIRDMESIPKTSPVFVQARVMLAKIYLEKRRDRAAYIKCYEAIVESSRDKQSYVMFGEAMMRIQEPLLAVDALKEALRRDPRDASLALRIGSAMVATHDFDGAVAYYEKATNANRSNGSLLIEFASLLARIGREKAAQQLLAPMRDEGHNGVLERMQVRVQALLILADIEKRLGNAQGLLTGLSQALAAQDEVLDSLRGDSPDAVAGEREKTAEIGFLLHEAYKEQGMAAEAEESLREEPYPQILKRAPDHSAAGLALARLRLAAGEVGEGATLCEKVLMADENNDDASMLLAEISALQGDIEPALGRFQVILAREPDNFRALFRLLLLLWRSASMELAEEFLDAARRATPRSAMQAGYHACMGLHQRCCNKPQDAIRSFNKARGDPEWGLEATYQMVEIFLDPNSDQLWAAVGDDEDALPENFQAAALGENLRAVRELLGSVKGAAATTSVRHRVLEAYSSMATGQRADAEQALSGLLEVANKNRDHVPTLLAIATAFVILRQKPKARNQLKRISKLPYSLEHGSEFERAWLSLASMYLKGGKFDLTNELCEKCLRYNQSCAPAWELKGQILEKEGAYKDAAEHYHHAWELRHAANAQSGYRLAFNYLKAGKVVEAMEVCHQVLEKFPDYSDIRKDILLKAWSIIKVPPQEA